MIEYWKKNKRQVNITITHLNRFHIRALRKDTKLNELKLDNIYAKLQLILWISLLEIEFNILLAEKEHLVTNFLKRKNIASRSETSKWKALITFCFKERYIGKQDRHLNITNIGDTNYHRYNSLITIVDQDLKPFIELRNKLAHGQWAVAFNFNKFDKNQDLTNSIWKLSKRDIMLLKSFVRNLPSLIKLLIISKKTFERDYDKHIGKIMKAKEDADLKFKSLLRK